MLRERLMVSNRRGVEVFAERYDGRAGWALTHLSDCFSKAEELGLSVRYVYQLVEHDEITVQPYFGVIGYTTEQREQLGTPRGFVNEFLFHAYDAD